MLGARSLCRLGAKLASAPLAPGAAFSLALCASLSAGLTGFGDAVLYIVLWSAADALALVPGGALRLAAALIAVVALTQAPLLLFAARRELARMLPYAVAMNLSAIPLSALGSWVLYHADVVALKRFVGAFFLLFATARLSAAAFALARERRERRLGAAAAAASAAAGTELDAPAAAALEAPSAPLASAPVLTAAPKDTAPQPPPQLVSIGGDAAPPPSPSGADAAASVADADIIVVSSAPSSSLFARAGRALRWAEARAHPISHLAPVPYSVRASLLLMLCTGCMSGFLSGLMGVGGPPLMVAFSLLVVDKDDIRAISALYGLFELPTRVTVMWRQSAAADNGSGFAAVDATLAACTVAGAFIGFNTGSFARRFVDSVGILRVLLGIVLVASGVLLGALESGAVALAFACGVAAWAAAIGTLLARPELADRLAKLLSGGGVAAAAAAAPSQQS